MALTPEQTNIVAEYTRQQRATVGEFARLLNHMPEPLPARPAGRRAVAY